jgi:hypothetical protein
MFLVQIFIIGCVRMKTTSQRVQPKNERKSEFASARAIHPVFQNLPLQSPKDLPSDHLA